MVPKSIISSVLSLIVLIVIGCHYSPERVVKYRPEDIVQGKGSDRKQPKIIITRPAIDKKKGVAIVPSGSYIEIEGLVIEEKVEQFTIDAKTVPLSNDGSFSHRVKVKPGYNKFTLVAVDSYDNRTTKVLLVAGSKDRPRILEPLSSGDATEQKKPDFGKYYALVIGNNDYKNLPKLKTAINDARAVTLTLRDLYDFKVELLLNGSRYDILSALDGLRAELTEKDNLLIYYAGHGYFDEEANRGYWLPTNASNNTSAEWISNADITDKIKAIRAKHVMVVADSCYSGTLTRGITVKLRDPDYLSRISRKRARTVLTSGGLEPVMDSSGGEHSVFTKAFLDALRENKSIMDGTQLFSQIRRPVMVNAPQTPQYSDIRFAGHEGGDFLFVRK